MKRIKLNKLLVLLFVLHSFFAFSQERRITGTVVDETNQPVIGVSINVKGTNFGAITDVDGKYEIKVSSNTSVLMFSYVGYKTLEVVIGDQTSKNITLDLDAAKLDEIVIKGFRGAEQRAIAFKREAASVVEAITPEDIGNYSDENIGDAIQRVPGLQVERDDSGNGGGDRVSVRGVGPDFVNITINGRTPLTAGSEGIDQLRQFNLDVLPTEVVQGAVVYKSSEAHLVEPGLGGAVDFQTIKPLSLKYGDAKNTFAVVNVRGDVNDYGENKAFKPRLSGLFAFKSNNNKFGFVVSGISSSSNRAMDSYNLSYAPKTFKENTGTATITHTNVLAPNLARYNPVLNSVNRIGVSAAVQGKIGKYFEVNADMLVTKYDNYSTRNQFRTFPGAELAPTTITFTSANLDIDENNVLRSFNTIGSNNPISRVGIAPTQYDNFQTSFMSGLNLKWEKDNWKVIGDYSYSLIDFKQRLAFTQVWMNVPTMTFDLNTDYAIIGFDQAASENVVNATVQNNLFLRDIMLKGNNKAVRIDAENKINDNLKLKFGARYITSFLDSRQAQLSGTSTLWDSNYLNKTSYFATYVTGTNFPNFGNSRNIGNNSWLTVNQDLIQANNPKVFSQTAGTSFEGDLFNVKNGALPLLPLNSWDLNEKTTSAYGQLDFSSKLFGVPFSGNIGARAVNWAVEGRAFSTISIVSDDTGTATTKVFAGVPTTASANRLNILPSLNLNFSLKDNLNLRLSAVNTVSNPDYSALRPTNAISFIDPATNPGINGSATLSNPKLKPFSSWQFDATGEWYNRAGGAFVISGFYKKISDFIVNQTTFGAKLSDYGDIKFDTTGVPDSVLQNQLLNVTSPVNFTDVDLYGFEVGFRQSLRFIGNGFKNFGLQANYTFVESKFDNEISTFGSSFPGSSKHNFNSVFYYDGKIFGLRVAYNTRSSFLKNIGGGSDIRSNVTFTDGSDRLDIRANFEVTKNLQLSASFQNLTASDRRDYINNDPTLFTQLTTQGAVYTLGARYKF